MRARGLIVGVCVVGLAACGSTSGGGARTAAHTDSGAAIFASNGCGGCHALSKAGTRAQVGPNLDTALKGKSAAFVRRSIVDPNAVIAKGYGAGIMPQTFGKSLTARQLDALVKYVRP